MTRLSSQKRRMTEAQPGVEFSKHEFSSTLNASLSPARLASHLIM